MTIDDLPLWMRPRRQFDFGLIAVLLIALNALFPLLRSGLPAWNDAPLSVYRAVEVANQIRSGVFYSRWASDFHYGYGSPIFNYIAPLPHYLSAYHQVVTDSDPIVSYKVIMVIAVLCAAVFMYLFARGRYGMWGALCAVSLYIGAPVFSNTLTWQNADLGLALGLAALPGAAWRLDRLWTKQTGARYFLAVLMIGLLILSDLPFALLGIPVLIVCAVTGSYAFTGEVSARPFIIGSFIAAFAITSFFWIPAFTEANAVRLLTTAQQPHLYLIPLTEMFGLVPLNNYTTLDPIAWRGVGLGSLIAVLFSFPFLLSTTDRPRIAARSLWIIGILAVLGAAVFPGTASLIIPTPYHLAAIGLFSFAVCAALAGYALTTIRTAWRIPLYLILMTAPFLTNLPALYPPEVPTVAALSAESAAATELPGYQIGSLRGAVLLPQNAGSIFPSPLVLQNRPAVAPPSEEADPSAILTDDPTLDPTVDPPVSTPTTDVDAGQIPSLRLSRINRVGGSEIRLDSLDASAINSTYLVETPRSLSLTLNIFDFPGWTAQLLPFASPPITVPLQSTEDSRLEMTLPQGNGRLSIYLEDTPIRQLATFISVIGILVAVFFARQSTDTVLIIHHDGEPEPIRYRHQLLFIGFALLVVAVSTAIRVMPSLLAAPPTPMTSTPRFLRGGVDLLGYTVTPGQPLLQTPDTLYFDVEVYWRAARPIGQDYQSELWLQTPDGVTVRQIAHRIPGGVPTSTWTFDRIVIDRFRVSGAELPTGAYDLFVGMGVCASALPCTNVLLLQSNDPFGVTEDAGIRLGAVLFGR